MGARDWCTPYAAGVTCSERQRDRIDRQAAAVMNRLNTVSLRLRLIAAVMVVLAVILILLSIAVSAIFLAQSNRNLDALLTGQEQLARQLARSGAGPQQIVNRMQAGGVQAYLVLRNGTEFGTPITSGTSIKTTTITLNAPTPRVDGAQLTLAIDTSLVSNARRTLRRVLLITDVIALLVSAALVAGAVRLALRPLDSMAALAKTVSQGNRGARLAPTRTDTEIGQTAQAFDEMLDELEGAEARAHQAEERTRAFLADAAHELRTPIAGVQAAAETLLHHDDQLDYEERQHLQALLVREAERAGALISDLLAAARLDAGIDLDLAPVSLRTLVHGEIDRIRLLHPEATVTMSGPEVVARADAPKVSSILRNVIDNAMRAAGAQGKVHVVVREQDQFAIAEIWDSGPGVPSSERERIFERLVRLDHGRANDTGGSGLGLAIARGYARAHGGDLTCEDPRGIGAMFRLVLPLEPREAAIH
ncbi:MAG TPA: ATP-binding protein [Propionibacteriaceae bacterium]